MLSFEPGDNDFPGAPKSNFPGAPKSNFSGALNITAKNATPILVFFDSKATRLHVHCFGSPW